MTRTRCYRSVLAKHIETFISLKRSFGFIYEFEAYELERFDKFCIEQGYTEENITRDLVFSWVEQIPCASAGYRSQRVSFIRQLALFMRGQGIDAYIPHHFSSKEVSVPYIPCSDEITALFGIIDSYEGNNNNCRWMAGEYPIAFRLMYCCGMRIAECSKLKRADVDLDNGILLIRHSKGDKDRLVYLPEGFAAICASYWEQIIDALGFVPEWFFPGKSGYKPISKTTFDLKFRQFWMLTPNARLSARRPTPHALRHAFVVERMNSWMVEGVDLDAMMPYLSKYLGHKDASETFYYYHQVNQAFNIVREKDTMSSRVIPEVVPYEI